jgi:hypothetical protein
VSPVVRLSLLVVTFAAAELPASAAARRDPCAFGPPLEQSVVLRPRAGTFYAADALNPDVVRFRGRYLLYFSGNRSAADPDRPASWHTGVAVAARPRGPFRVVARVRLPFLNGGTIVDGRRLLQAASENLRSAPVVYSSRDGMRWDPLVQLPQPSGANWRRLESDFSLVRRRGGFDAYFAGRMGRGADIGVAHYRGGKWTGFRRLLRRVVGAWDGFDLGEPAFFRAHGHSYLLYVGMPAEGKPRQIGLAYLSGHRWRRCGQPFIRVAPAYPGNAIDPEPFIVGDRLYVFFGGGSSPSITGGMRGRILLRTYRLR